MSVELPVTEFARRDWQESTGGTVRFALVGLGWWTVEEGIPAIAESTLCETTVVVSGARDKAQRVAADHETIERALTYDAFLDGEAREAYDAVYVATPNALHLPYVEAAAEFDKAVLCEKPAEATAERAALLADAATETNAPVMIAYRMHTDPAVRRARELITAGDIGDPVHVHGSMAQPLLEMNPNTEQWRLDPELTGYGATVMDLGVYPLNTARFLLDADPVAVTAQFNSDHGAFGDVPDEHASFQATFDDGTAVNCTASQNAQKSSHLRVIGTDGEILLEPVFYHDETRRMTVRIGETTAEVTVPPINQMTEEFDYLADCVLTDSDPLPDADHGLVDLEAMAAIYEAAATDERVTVGE